MLAHRTDESILKTFLPLHAEPPFRLTLGRLGGLGSPAKGLGGSPSLGSLGLLFGLTHSLTHSLTKTDSSAFIEMDLLKYIGVVGRASGCAFL